MADLRHAANGDPHPGRNGVGHPAIVSAPSGSAGLFARSDPDLDRVEWSAAAGRQEESRPAVRVGVIGYGYWGPNLVRNFSEFPGSVVATIADRRTERLELAYRRYRDVTMTTDHRDILVDPDVEAVVISTPISTHYELALAALEAGKHVLVEKTLTETSAQAEQLIAEADKRGLVLMVDHTFVYTGAVQKIKERVQGGMLGQIYYYDSVRVNLGLFQHDVDVLWDLAVHDLSIMDHVLGQMPLAVSAAGIASVPGKPIHTGYLTCYFENNVMAHFHVNWLAPVKIRRTLLGGDRQMIVYDDLEPSEKIKVYDRGITVDAQSETVYELMVGYRVGDMWAPQVSLTEALRVEVQHFVDCVRTGRTPITDGRSALRVVRILEAASASLRLRGHPVEVAAGQIGDLTRDQ